jgi:geranylgeranyl pyrophosphate synthase
MPELLSPVEALFEQARLETDARLHERAARLARETPPPLGEALAYALGTTGKRFRPALVLASYHAAGGRGPGIAGIAAAVEAVHTYSLVHDDLPCMDDDDQRRGRPTTHRRFDVPAATRAGWLLVPVAIELLAAGVHDLGQGAAVLGRMATTLLRAAGAGGMVGGQWLDLEAEGRDVGLEALRQIHRGKTGALIQACCVLGGQAARADPTVLAALEGYGAEVGLAFQIADDILDVTATTEALGKTVGRDAARGKSTYVSLLGVERAREEARGHTRRALGHLSQLGRNAESLAALADYIAGRAG